MDPRRLTLTEQFVALFSLPVLGAVVIGFLALSHYLNRPAPESARPATVDRAELDQALARLRSEEAIERFQAERNRRRQLP